MKHLITLMALVCLFSCRKQSNEKLGSNSPTKKNFNLATVKKFAAGRLLLEQKSKGNILTKTATLSQNGSSSTLNFNELLLWDYAFKEINQITGDYSYLVPLAGSNTPTFIQEEIAQEGYKLVNLYTDHTYDNVYARLRDYRPNKNFIDSLCLAKNKSIGNHTYLEYNQLLTGEKFNGHIVVYNLDSSPFKLIEVRNGKVYKVTIY